MPHGANPHVGVAELLLRWSCEEGTMSSLTYVDKTPHTITEDGSESPCLEAGDEWPSSLAEIEQVCENPPISTLPTESCLGVRRSIGPAGKSTTVPLDTVLSASEM